MRSERLPKAKAHVYLGKAREFADAMDRAASEGHWNAVGLNAVHTVISAMDALTTFYLGQRSRSPNHGDVLTLAAQIDVDGIRPRIQQAERVLDAKNQVEYEARGTEADEAEAMQKRAARFLAWVEDHVG